MDQVHLPLSPQIFCLCLDKTMSIEVMKNNLKWLNKQNVNLQYLRIDLTFDLHASASQDKMCQV